MGMGCTMMPIMSAALATLQDAQIARGSTLMNIVQQAGGSIGTAVMSVVLTNLVKNDQVAGTFLAVKQGAVPAEQVPPSVLAAGPAALADAFGSTYVLGVTLVALCLIPALFLPRRRITRADTPEGAAAVPVGMH
jgi:hypothetical protein